MRSELGKIALDTVFRERELLNISIVGKNKNGPMLWYLIIWFK
jgi:hypothetical protein